MFKRFASLLCLFFVSIQCIFGNTPDEALAPPPRMDQLDDSSYSALIKLERARNILSTLVSDPDSYHLILSSNTAFGGEAVPPYVFSDKPTVIIYQGSLAPSRSDEELSFLLAHELSHLLLSHHENMDVQMEQIFTGAPIGISGITFTPFYQKLQEREADLNGLKLYTDAGYDLNFFEYTLNLINRNPNIHFGTSKLFAKPLSTLSIKNSHFSIQERFQVLVSKT